TPPPRLERRTGPGIEKAVKALLPECVSQRRGKVCAGDIPERRAFAAAVLHDAQELVGGQNLCFFSFGYVRAVGLSRQDDEPLYPRQGKVLGFRSLLELRAQQRKYVARDAGDLR